MMNSVVFNFIYKLAIVVCIIAYTIASILGGYIWASDNPDVTFKSMEVVASSNPIDESKGNANQWALWKGNDALVLNTHGGAQGYIMAPEFGGDEAAAVNEAITTAANEVSYTNELTKVRWYQGLNVNDFDVIYINCCYPVAHQDAVVDIAYDLETGALATTEQQVAEALGEGSELGHKQVPVRILNPEAECITYSNAFCKTEQLVRKDLKINASKLKVAITMTRNFIVNHSM